MLINRVPQNYDKADSADIAWLGTLCSLLEIGEEVRPRDFITREVRGHMFAVDMRYPWVTAKTRKANICFAAAEALWILNGQDDLASLLPWNKNMADYSDDGVTLYGAYGPPFIEQREYVGRTLINDPHTRQAGMTIWRRNPQKSKDIPCTIGLWFMVRNGRLDVWSIMRSSDAWLGLPYDIFTFSMLGFEICALLHELGRPYSPGILYNFAVSRHLYAQNIRDAERAVNTPDSFVVQPPAPAYLFNSSIFLRNELCAIRDKQTKYFRKDG